MGSRAAQIEQLLKALYYNDERAYSRNRPSGMSYLNRFIIEEDTQFECVGIVEWKSNALNVVQESFLKYLERKFHQILNESNSDFIGHLILSNEFEFSYFEHSIPQVPDVPLMLTRVGSERLECVQKEQNEKIYNVGVKIEYNVANSSEHKTFQVYKSIGDDIDDFYDRIKTNNINFTDMANSDLTYLELKTDGYIPTRPFIPLVKTFHLSMLSDEDEREMNFKETDDGNRILVNFKNETSLSKTEQNYALSLCARKTILVKYKYRSKLPLSEIDGPAFIKYYIDEPDPWQERIIKNFEEFKSKKDYESASDAFLSDWESDSSDL